MLSLFFIGTCVQLALAANIAKLPKETLDWFANPANIDSDQVGVCEWCWACAGRGDITEGVH